MRRYSILFAISFAYLLLSHNQLSAQKSKISLEDLYKKSVFYERTVDGITSMKDGESYTANDNNGRVIMYSYSSGKQQAVLFDPSTIQNADLSSFAGYILSMDESKLLIKTNIKSVYRHSFSAIYYIYDIKNKTIEPLLENTQVMLATISPDGKKVAYVKDNDIFIKDIYAKTVTQATNDGLKNSIINGAADWVYEEEFSLLTGFQWSPDSKKIAYYKFDERDVQQFNMTKYNNNLYPENYTFKYPKAGEKNSIVSIHVYDIESNKSTKMDIGPETDQYIARIKWTYTLNQLSILRLNRHQNKLDILLADASSGNSKNLYTEVNKFYIQEPSDDLPTYMSDGKNFLITSEKSGYNQLYLYSMDGTLVKQLTHGTNEVTDVYGYDQKTNRVYFQAFDNSPARKAIYSVKIDGQDLVKLSMNSGNNYAEFSRTFKYFILFHSNASTPNLVTLHKNNGKQIRVLEDNAQLVESLKRYDIPAKEFFTFKTLEGIDLNAYIIKPSDFDSTKKYPVIMTQYSGPGSISVRDVWDLSWDQYLASTGYIVVCVDGRGTGGKGELFRKITFGQLGYYESIDQIESAKYIRSLSYVNPSRIGIWGWSYGGYMSSLCLFKGADLFKMAIAVAPVTNWRFYDSIYTERFMGLPQDNPLGYDNNSPINFVDKLKGKLLIVHGTGDDNVHLQNSIEMIEKLVQANKQFDMFLYPDKNHGIYGGNATFHLFTKLSNYVKENL
ncbi:MAG: S9 family peptidase [Tenuifilaceae bacterium]